MIIQCEKCQTNFSINESLLKKEGSKVRCSSCKHIFVAYPTEQIITEAGEEDREIDFNDLLRESSQDMEELDGLLSEEPDDFERKEEIEIEKPLYDVLIKEEPEDSTESLFASTKKRPAKSHFLTILLVVILALLGMVAAVFFWAPDMIPSSLTIFRPAKQQKAADTGVRRLSFKTVTGSFVDSKKAGSLFVIRGTVTNNYPKNRSFIRIKGSILDDKGQVIRKKMAYAGNNFEEKELKVMPLEKIKKAMQNRSGMGKKNVNVAPGATIQFMIIFENLPENLSEFTVEAVSSSPGI